MEYTLTPGMFIFVVVMVGFAGFVDAIAGGGGLISLPAYLAAGLPVHITYGTNKFTAMCGTSLATAKYFKSKVVDLKVALIAALGSFTGSFLGSQIVVVLSEEILQTMLIAVLPIIAFIILFKKDNIQNNQETMLWSVKKGILGFVVGFVIGVYDAFFGPATGTIALFAFHVWMKYDLAFSNGNAKVLNLASNVASLITYWMAGVVYFQLAIPAAIANILGAYLGSKLVLSNGTKYVKPMMTIVIIALLIKTLIEFIS